MYDVTQHDYSLSGAQRTGSARSPVHRRGPGPSRRPSAWAALAHEQGGGDVRERRLAKFRQNVARFRLYRLRFLQENMRFAAFFKIYQILKLKFLKFHKMLQIIILRHLQFFADFSRKLLIFQTDFFAKILRLQRCKRMQIL